MHHGCDPGLRIVHWAQLGTVSLEMTSRSLHAYKIVNCVSGDVHCILAVVDAAGSVPDWWEHRCSTGSALNGTD